MSRRASPTLFVASLLRGYWVFSGTAVAIHHLKKEALMNSNSAHINAPAIELELKRILNVSPYDSTAKSEITMSNNRYWCRLRIVSRAGIFSAIAAAGNPNAAFRNARRRILAELKVWRRNRVFSSASPRGCI